MTERDIFLSALDAPPADRSAVVDARCGTDRDLRDRVRGLLAAHDRASGFLDPPAPDAVATGTFVPGGGEGRPAGVDRTGMVLADRYTLLQPIGDGGMGCVWLAEQARPVRRPVAVKLIKDGMDSARVLGRFEAERQALALMDHPNIARVLDAGTAPDGRPFFVMELVRGEPLSLNSVSSGTAVSLASQFGTMASWTSPRVPAVGIFSSVSPNSKPKSLS